MIIAIDSSEARESSLLPQSVIKASLQVMHLESTAAADFLISPLSKPKLPRVITETKRSRAVLFKHAQAGCLVQRKSGDDLLNSLKKLEFIIDRMMAWSPRNVLLVDGDFREHRGKVVCNGRKSKWDWSSMWGLLENFQRQGGVVRFLESPENITSWITSTQRRLIAIHADRPKLVKRPWRRTISWSQEDRFKEWLIPLPGIGKKKADWVGDYCGSGIMSLVFLTDEENAGQCGVGSNTIQEIRDYVGLKPGQYPHIKDERFK